VKSAVAARVLVAEDDPAVRNSVVRVLELEGHSVTAVGDGRAALSMLYDGGHDAAVLDVKMPFVDGLTVCRDVRSRGITTPILLLTARVQIGDTVEGLDAGADDYLMKPFAIDELSARVRALLRRRITHHRSAVLTVGDITIDVESRMVRRAERVVSLTKTEFNLLELLAENAEVVLTREQIYERIWGYHFETNSKSLDVYVGYLRRKLTEGGEADPITTVRGVGYSLKHP